MSTKNSKRVNVKVGKQIAVGTYAFPLTQLEKKRYGSMTHRWTCLLRSPTDENMTHYIKKVQFDLDPSFLNPKRVLTTMPYEVTEVGWGEFYIGVKLYFVDESLEPVQLQHHLVLNPPENTGQNPTTATNETFDEIIFNEPSAWFYKHLICSINDKLPPHKYNEHFWDYGAKDKETTCRYICCQSYFQNESCRLLAEASELSRQIQFLQEKANIIKNPSLLSKNSGSRVHSITMNGACATPTGGLVEPLRRAAAGAGAPEGQSPTSSVTSLAETKIVDAAGVTGGEAKNLTTDTMQLDEKEPDE